MRHNIRRAFAVLMCACTIASQLQMPVLASEGEDNIISDIEQEYVAGEGEYEFVDNYPTDGDWQDGDRIKSENAIELFNSDAGVLYSQKTSNKYTGLTYTHASMFDKCTVINGIDVSKWNGTIDWAKVKKAGVEYAIIRVGNRGVYDGSLNEDPLYKTNIKGAIAAGIKVGVYIYSQAITTSEARAEADYVLKRIKSYNITMPVVIDYEYYDGPGGRLYDAHLSASKATSVCAAFCERVKAAGYTPMIYANASMLSNNLNASSLAKKYTIWLASWGTKNSYTGNYDHWQYTSSGTVNGISGRVDCNFWYNPVKSTGLKLSATNLSLNLGSTYKIKGTITPSDSTDIIAWTSSNPTVAYVNQSGNIVTGYRGTTTITGTTTTGVSAQCKVTVYDNMSSYKISSLSSSTFTYNNQAFTPQPTVTTAKEVALTGTTTIALNMRKGPDTEYPIVTSMPAGTKVTIYNTFGSGDDKWYSIKATVGSKTYKGYSFAGYINAQTGYRTLSKSYYTVSYASNVNAGAGSTIVTGLTSGYLKGSINKAFSIAPQSIKYAVFSDIDAQQYTGNQITPKLTVKYNGKTLVEGKDYKLSYNNNINSGAGSVVISGIGNFNNSVTKTFKITGSRHYYVESIADQVWTGNAVTPAIVIKDSDTNQVLSSSDYTVTYSNNIEEGVATATVKGIGKYEGTMYIDFNIVSGEVQSSNKITVYNVDYQEYTGEEICPEFIVKSGNTVLNADMYLIDYSNNISIGTATAIIKGKGTYSGTIKIEYEIAGADISTSRFWTNNVAAVEYSGYEIKPQIILENTFGSLVQDRDYTIAYSNNTNAGKAKIILSGIGNYRGTKVITFNITQRNIELGYFSSIASQVYLGSALRPIPAITYSSASLKNNVDYKVTYSNNINKGTATATITGIGNYKGTVKKTFTIQSRSILTCSVAPIASKNYTGKAIKPNLIIKYGSRTLVKNVDYTLSYASNTNIGTATIKITAKGNYTGTKNISFIIIPKKISGVGAKNITKSSMTIKWSKANATGYQIYRATAYDGSYKKIRTIKSANTTSYTNKGLSSQKEYYYKVRAYKVVNGKYYYGTFSNVLTRYTDASYTKYAVTKSASYLRNHAGSSFKKVVKLSKGTSVKILAATYDSKGIKWYKVSYKKNGKTYKGYLAGGWVNVENRGKVKVDVLNVRKKASVSSAILTKLSYKRSVRITKTVKDRYGRKWYAIKISIKGKSYTGYVLAKHIKQY